MSTPIHPTGEFTGVVTHVQISETTASKTPYISVGVTTEHGRVYWSGWLGSKDPNKADTNIKRTLKTLSEFGFDGNFEDLAQLKQTEARCTVEHEVGADNVPRARISFLHQKDTAFGDAKPIEKSFAKTLNTRWRTLVTQGEIKPTAPAPKKITPIGANRVEETQDDNCPF